MEKIPTTPLSGINKIYKAVVIFKIAYWQYKWQVLTMALLGFLGSLLSGLGIGMLIPLFAFVTEKKDIDSSNIFHQLISQIFSFLHLSYNLPFILVLMVSLFIAKAGLIVLVGYINEVISARYVRDNSSMLLRKTLGASWSFLMNQKIGYLDRIISSDVALSGGILMSLGDILIRIASLTAYTFIALKISSSITILSLLGGLIIFVFLKLLILYLLEEDLFC